uniref:Uncharacterized protein n=1 Tax=Leptobrachium leishanense TaxID=445787 RepID=A0A8C5ME53_9ANUR
MKVAFALITAVAAFTAYYVYSPMPSTVSERWKLMLLDAIFRCAQDLYLIDFLLQNFIMNGLLDIELKREYF